MSQLHVEENQELLPDSVDSVNEELEHQNITEEEELKQTLLKEQALLAEERRKFQKEKENFHIYQHAEETRLKRETELFEMKWRILEKELVQLAKEKQEVAAERESCRRIKAEHQKYTYVSPGVIQGEMFFSGVDSELGMKKRYKDLIKIFHPDNRDGDTHTLQIINKEYDEMKKMFYAL